MNLSMLEQKRAKNKKIDMQFGKRKQVKAVTHQYNRILKNNKTMTIFVSLVAFVFVVFASSVVITGVARSRAEAAEAQAAQAAAAEKHLREQIIEQEKKDRRESAFADVELTATGAIVYDVNALKTIFERNADRVLPIASITKVMTIITASDYLDDDSEVYIDEEVINTEGDSGLIYGETWSFKELADLTMIVSSNDGSVAIAKAAGREIKLRNEAPDTRTDLEVFVEKMNSKAREIGLRDSVFHNPSGLDLNLETEPGSLSTARDIAQLLTYALTEKPDLLNNSALNEHVVTSGGGRQLSVRNTNQAAGKMPGLIISKTGNTLQAGGTLGVAVDIGLMQPVVIVALGSTITDRVGDVDALYEAAKVYFENL